MSIIFTLQRQAETPHSTSGIITGPDGKLICHILERGAGNPDHPRIPLGVYIVSHKPLGSSEFDKSFTTLLGADYKGVLWLPNVPGRTNIEVHTANFVEQLLGCLATGLSIGRDAQGDFSVPGGQSSPAYKSLYLAIAPHLDGPEDVRLYIRDIAPDAALV